MTVLQRPLTFSAIDELAFMAAAGTLDPSQLPARYVLLRLGPLLELQYLVAGGRLPIELLRNWLIPHGGARMIAALRENRERWMSSDRGLGFIRTVRTGPNADTLLTGFLMDAQRVARDLAELPGVVPAQLAAAMEELENNIHEHSGAVDTGILAYRATRGEFEFVAADRGVGILASLRQSPTFAALTDHGKALEAALAEGVSRFGNNTGRGNGFRPIFLSLLDMYGSLRFRSGDHALIMDGTSPQLSTAQLAEKPVIDGFFASVLCQDGA